MNESETIEIQRQKLRHNNNMPKIPTEHFRMQVHSMKNMKIFFVFSFHFRRSNGTLSCPFLLNFVFLLIFFLQPEMSMRCLESLEFSGNKWFVAV